MKKLGKKQHSIVTNEHYNDMKKKTCTHFSLIVFYIICPKEAQLSFLAVIGVITAITVASIASTRPSRSIQCNYCNNHNHKASNIRYNPSNIASK